MGFIEVKNMITDYVGIYCNSKACYMTGMAIVLMLIGTGTSLDQRSPDNGHTC